MAGQIAAQLPAAGSQQAQWAQVVQERRGTLGERVYTVAAQTDAEGLLYLTVGVLRERGGAVALSGYPAFVGAPPSAPAQNLVEGFREVDESSLAEVVERALRNYLDDAGSELAADLTESAEVSLPTLPLTLDGVQELKWLPSGGSVFAVLTRATGAACATRSPRARRRARGRALEDIRHPDGPTADAPPSGSHPGGDLGVPAGGGRLRRRPAARAPRRVPSARRRRGRRRRGRAPAKAASSNRPRQGRRKRPKSCHEPDRARLRDRGDRLVFRRDFKEAVGVFASWCRRGPVAQEAGVKLVENWSTRSSGRSGVEGRGRSYRGPLLTQRVRVERRIYRVEGVRFAPAESRYAGSSTS